MPVARLDRDQLEFPDPEDADPEGLLAIGGDLRPERLEAAYRRGIFPWYSRNQPILWWCPPERCILAPDGIRVSRSLRAAVRQGRFEVTFDRAFADVIRACATARPEGTWITPAMRAGYEALHARGLAHSVEAWRGGELVGGLYGVSLGAAFFGESMFSRASDASKVALVALGARLVAWEMPLLDCQMPNDHLESLGAFVIARDEFLERLAAALRSPTRRGSWDLEAGG